MIFCIITQGKIKMVKQFLNFLKGIAIGISNMIPGFSGGTMAVLLNAYDDFIYGFGHIFTNFITVLKRSLTLYLGMLVGMASSLFGVLKLLELYPFITIMFFIGLILGSFRPMIANMIPGKLRIRNIIAMIIAIAVVVLLAIFSDKTGAISENVTAFTYVLVFLVGIVSSSSMVIPGISGSFILMVFGFYIFVMGSIATFVENMFNFSYENYLGVMFVLLTFAAGCLIGITLASRFMEILLKKYPKTIYFTIFGLVIASPFCMIYQTLKEYTVVFDTWQIIFSIISLLLGAALVVVSDILFLKRKKRLEKQDELENADINDKN